MSLFETDLLSPSPRRSMGSHEAPHHGATDVWLTPPHIITALGAFDLDPCAAPAPRPWNTANTHYTLPTNGLFEPWFGRVWLNPPYGELAARWVGRLAEYGNGITLLFARTETEMFFRSVWGKADAVLFLDGRLHFHRPDGKRSKNSSGAPSCLVAYGEHNVNALAASGLAGCLVRITERPRNIALGGMFGEEPPAPPSVSELAHRDGKTFSAAFDAERLARQHAIVWDVMKDGEWHLLSEVSALTGQPEASCSSRIRDFRKAKWGGHTVHSRRRPGTDPRSGVWEYRLLALEVAA